MTPDGGNPAGPRQDPAAPGAMFGAAGVNLAIYALPVIFTASCAFLLLIVVGPLVGLLAREPSIEC